MQRSFVIESPTASYAGTMGELGYTVPSGIKYTYGVAAGGISTARITNTELCGTTTTGNDDWSQSAATSLLVNGNHLATTGGTAKFSGCN